MSESRLLRLFIDDLNKQRAKAGASAIPAGPTRQTFTNPAPVGSRNFGYSAPSNVGTPQQSTGTGVAPGYSTTTDPTAIENAGPAPGQNWTDTISAGNPVPGFQSTYDRLKAAADMAEASAGGNRASMEDRLKIRQQAEANELARIKQEQEAQAMQVANGQRQAMQGAALSTGSINQKTQPGLSLQERSQARGQMRQAAGSPAPAAPTPAASGGAPAGPSAAPSASPSALSPTTPSSGAGQPSPKAPGGASSAPPSKPGAKAGETPQGPMPTPGSNLLRSIAATIEDPILQAILLANADEADAAGNPDNPVSQDQFNAGATSISKPYDAIDRILQQARQTSEKTYASQKAFLEGQFERNDKLISLQQESVQNQLQFAQDKAVRDQAEANKKHLDSQTIMLALGGGFGSADGNNEIMEAKLKGEQAIIDLNKQFGFKRADVSLQFTQMHQEASDTYQSAWLDATDRFETKVSDLDIQGISNEGAKMTALTNAYKDYVSDIKTARKEYAKIISDGTNLVYDAINIERDDRRAEEQLGWNILNQAIDNYGSMVPKSIIDRVKSMLPEGTDIYDVINTPTFAERNSKRISGAGGTGSGTAYDTSGVTPQGQAFSDVTANQLREAVDRVTLNFGGTGAERNRKRAEYLDRIASGESTASIMTSMQMDYWASQKGAPRTAHDGRTAAQGSAEALQSYVDFYGIGPDNDGVLGQIDSRVEGFKSVFGLSSEEYNNLANNVGNIRAKIIKENYGAAVTPQELALAQSYVPSMTDKGAMFLTKLQNLKAYNAYLDAKVFSANVGLPPPKPPVPVTLSGNSMAGPGKYSSDDITSALTE